MATASHCTVLLRAYALAEPTRFPR